MKYLKPNPDFAAWCSEDQSNYVRKARAEYERRRGALQPTTPSWRWRFYQDPAYRPEAAPKRDSALIRRLYEEGCALGRLRCSYAEFIAILLNPYDSYVRPRGRKEGHGWRTPDGTLHLKISSRFRKKPNAQPRDVKSALKQTREDWRARKGFARDQAKGGTWCKCPRSIRKWAIRDRRAKEARVIHSGDWDNYLTEVNRDHIDNWDCC